MFYYMEGDNTVLSSYWLDALAAEIAASRPFSVLGGRYAGYGARFRQGFTFEDAIGSPRLLA
jgi:hypothetical protein